MKYASVLLALGCLVIAGAQQWGVELIGSSFTSTDVCVRRDSIRTYVAYVTGEGSICIATKDTIWHYETLDTSLVHAGFHFALGPAGLMAVSGVDGSYRPVVVQRSDSVWSRIWADESLAAYDADSVPAVVYCAYNQAGTAGYVVVGTWLDSAWRVDTAERFEPSNQFVELTLYDADGSAEAGPSFLICYGHGLPKCGQSPWSIEVDKGYRSGAAWSLVGLGGGTGAVVHGYDIVSGGPDTASAAVYSNGYTTFDRDPVCAGRVTDAAVQVDSAGRELIAYVTSDSVLRFAYKDTRWHYREVPGVTTATGCDLALDDYGQPMIASEDVGGLWLAHGVDMLGVADGPNPQATSHKLEPTILSGASGAKRLASGVVFDAMGRRASCPRTGIYFVLSGPSPVAGEPSAVTKVVTTR